MWPTCPLTAWSGLAASLGAFNLPLADMRQDGAEVFVLDNACLRNLPQLVDDLTDVFAWREERTVSSNLTLQYDKVVFLLEPNEITRELRRKRVTVVDYPDGRLAIRYRGLDLPYTTPSDQCIVVRRAVELAPQR